MKQQYVRRCDDNYGTFKCLKVTLYVYKLCDVISFKVKLFFMISNACLTDRIIQCIMKRTGR